VTVELTPFAVDGRSENAALAFCWLLMNTRPSYIFDVMAYARHKLRCHSSYDNRVAKVDKICHVAIVYDQIALFNGATGTLAIGLLP